MPKDDHGLAPFVLQPRNTMIGAQISEIDLRKPLDDSIFYALTAAFDRYSVVVFRNQNLTPEQRIVFSRRFGPLQINVHSEFNKPGYPEIYTVSNILVNGKPIGSRDAGRYWHSALCYLPQPAKASLMYALEVPQRDGASLGDTMFASAGAAYDDLPADIKKRLAGLRAVNSYNAMFNRKAAEFGVRPSLSNEEQKNKYPNDAVHPVIRTHPITGRKCIYVREGYTTHILELPESESRKLLDLLFAQITKPEYIYRHSWRVGDLVMWDNCAVQHLASFDYAPPLRRHMERTTVEGSIPH
ncbi:MAG: TauD/TfdA family dioxygenase [Deltaproteobacteria bacterium]|nr:TauD/TfdA family dioxygenase [Deltaproteobacteria bacterium]